MPTPSYGFQDLAIQPDGQILVVYQSRSPINGSFFTVLERLHPDGSIDPDIEVYSAQKVIALGNGQILVSGVGAAGGTLYRLNADGSLDPTFGATEPLPDKAAQALALQADGKILIAGSFPGEGYRLKRLNPDGSIDSTFVGATQKISVSSIAMQPDGGIIVAASSTFYGPADELLRLNVDGSRDPSFNADPSLTGFFAKLAVQQDGKILALGTFTGSRSCGVARYNVNGDLDHTFQVTPITNAEGSALVLQGDGRIFVGGQFSIVNGVPHGDIVRLFNDDAPPGNLEVTPSSSFIFWQRSGAVPPLDQVYFDLSTDLGKTWTIYGAGDPRKSSSDNHFAVGLYGDEIDAIETAVEGFARGKSDDCGKTRIHRARHLGEKADCAEEQRSGGEEELARGVHMAGKIQKASTSALRSMARECIYI